MKNVIFAVCFLTFCRTIPKKPRKKVIFDNKTQHQITDEAVSIAPIIRVGKNNPPLTPEE